MKIEPRIVVAAIAVALGGYALYLLIRPNDALDAAQEAYVGPDGEPVDVREQALAERRRLAAAARGQATDPDAGALPLDDEEVPPPPIADDPGAPITPASARAGFDYAMRRVERLAGRKRLKPEQWETLYREANDAYAALATVLDANDAAELAELEAAHVRLKEGLDRVRVRGQKFGP